MRIMMRRSNAKIRSSWLTTSRTVDCSLNRRRAHFAFLQNPRQFNADVLHFLMHLKGESWPGLAAGAQKMRWKSKKRRN